MAGTDKERQLRREEMMLRGSLPPEARTYDGIRFAQPAADQPQAAETTASVSRTAAQLRSEQRKPAPRAEGAPA